MKHLRTTLTGTLVTADDHHQHFKDAINLLRSVRVNLSSLLEDCLDGVGGTFKDLAAKHAELESALRRAFETEARWNEWTAKQDDAALPGEIDLAAVRQDIACRLARLSECCQEEG